jgi:hypothetical protein
MSKTNGDFVYKDGVDLKDYFNAQIEVIRTLITANDRNYNQRFDAVTQATESALAAADRAVTKAEVSTEKRFEGVNEFRQSLADQARAFMPRSEAELLIKAVNEKVDALNILKITQQSENIGQKQGMAQIALIAGVVSALVGILVRFI